MQQKRIWYIGIFLILILLTSSVFAQAVCPTREELREKIREDLEARKLRYDEKLLDKYVAAVLPQEEVQATSQLSLEERLVQWDREMTDVLAKPLDENAKQTMEGIVTQEIPELSGPIMSTLRGVSDSEAEQIWKNDIEYAQKRLGIVKDKTGAIDGWGYVHTLKHIRDKQKSFITEDELNTGIKISAVNPGVRIPSYRDNEHWLIVSMGDRLLIFAVSSLSLFWEPFSPSRLVTIYGVEDKEFFTEIEANVKKHKLKAYRQSDTVVYIVLERIAGEKKHLLRLEKLQTGELDIKTVKEDFREEYHDLLSRNAFEKFMHNTKKNRHYDFSSLNVIACPS